MSGAEELDDEKLIYWTWKVADEFLDNGYVEMAIKVLYGLSNKRDRFLGNLVLGVKTRLRLASLLLNYTTNYLEAKRVLEQVKLDIGGNKTSLSIDQRRELMYLRIICFKDLYTCYYHLSNPGLARRTLTAAIALCKMVRNKSWLAYFRIQLLRMLYLTKRFQNFIEEVNSYIAEHAGDKKMTIVYNLIKTQVMLIMETTRDARYYEEVQRQIDLTNHLINEISDYKTLTKKGNVKIKEYWRDNLNFLVMKIHILTLQIICHINQGYSKRFVETIRELEPNLNNYYSLTRPPRKPKEPKEGEPIPPPLPPPPPPPKREYVWVRRTCVISLGFLLSAILHRSETRIEQSFKMINKGYDHVNRRIEQISEFSNRYMLSPATNDESLLLLCFQFLFLFNRCLLYLGKGDFVNSYKDIHRMEDMMKNPLLQQQYIYKLFLLRGIYHGIMDDHKQANQHFDAIILSQQQTRGGGVRQSDIQIKGWAEVFKIAIQIRQYDLMKEPKHEGFKSQIFNEINRLQRHSEYNQILGLSCVMLFLKGTICSLSGADSVGEIHLKHGLDLGNSCRNNNFTSRILTVLGDVYSKTKAVATSRKCFGSALTKEALTKDIIAQQFTFSNILKNNDVLMETTDNASQSQGNISPALVQRRSSLGGETRIGMIEKLKKVAQIIDNNKIKARNLEITGMKDEEEEEEEEEEEVEGE